MIRKFRLWLIRNWKWYRHRSLYIIADPSDNSITMSKGLCLLIDVFNLDETKVFVFEISKMSKSGIILNHFAFTINPDIEQPTQFCDIQYNSKYHTIGFESLCPTVNRILYDYCLPTHKVKLSVDIDATPQGMTYYKILRPYDQPAS